MGFRQGFGTVKGQVTLNKPKQVCVLRFGRTAHITYIAASFVLAAGGTPITSFEGASVTIINQKDVDNTIQPDPRAVNTWRAGPGTPNYLPGLADPVFEHRFNGPSMWWDQYFGERGIPLEANTDYSVILSQPSIDGGTGEAPNIVDSIGILTVHGWIEGGEDLGKFR